MKVMLGGGWTAEFTPSVSPTARSVYMEVISPGSDLSFGMVAPAVAIVLSLGAARELWAALEDAIVWIEANDELSKYPAEG